MFNFFSKKDDVKSNEFVAAVSGEIIPLTAVKDEVFSKGMLGNGIAIIPNDDFIVASCDGVVTMMFPTKHAFSIKNVDGIEILVHIGIDTINNNGIGFKRYVEQGDIVKAGDKVIRMNTYDLKNEGYDLTTMMLFPGFEKIKLTKNNGFAIKGKTIFAYYNKEDLNGDFK